MIRSLHPLNILGLESVLLIALTAIQNTLGSMLPMAHVTQDLQCTFGQLEITQDALGISESVHFLCQSCLLISLSAMAMNTLGSHLVIYMPISKFMCSKQQVESYHQLNTVIKIRLESTLCTPERILFWEICLFILKCRDAF